MFEKVKRLNNGTKPGQKHGGHAVHLRRRPKPIERFVGTVVYGKPKPSTQPKQWNKRTPGRGYHPAKASRGFGGGQSSSR